MMKRAILAVVAIVLVSSLAVAGPPAKNRIPDTAKWAVHFDVEKITNSAIAGGMLEIITGEGSPAPKEKAEKALEVWEILGKLKSLTLYGSTSKEQDAVVVADHRYNEAEAMKLLHISDDCPTLSHGRHRIYTFPPKHSHKRGTNFVCFHSHGFACFHSDEVVIVAMTLDRLKEALDLLDGKGKPLTKDNPLTKMLVPSKGSFLVAAAVDLDKIMKAPAKTTSRRKKQHGALLRKSKSARFEVGEAGENTFASLSVTAATEEDALNMYQVVQGLRAMLLLRQQEEDQQNAKIAKVARAIKISQEGKNVAVSIKYPVEDILAAIQVAAKRRAAATQPQKETTP